MHFLKNTQYFHITKYRKYTGYDRRKSKILGNSKILCMGSCDLASIKPNDVMPFSWAEHLTIDYRCDQIDEFISLSIGIECLKEYILHYGPPEYLCYVIPIMGDSSVELVDNGVIGYSQNSMRLVKFLNIKKIISDNHAESLYTKINELASCSTEQKISYVCEKLKILGTICIDHNIKFLWSTNATKTSNEFYSPIIDDILALTEFSHNYTGWTTNLDSLPDSSCGPRSQKIIYENFLKRIV